MYRPDDLTDLTPLARLRQAELLAAAERAQRTTLTLPPRRWSLVRAFDPARRSLGIALIRAGQRLHGAARATAGGDPAGILVAR